MGGEEGRGGGGAGGGHPAVPALRRGREGHAVARLGRGQHLGGPRAGQLLPRAVGGGVVAAGGGGEQRGGGEGEGRVCQRGEGGEHAQGAQGRGRAPGVAGRVEVAGRRGEPWRQEGGLGVGGGHGGEARHRDQRRHGEVGEGGRALGMLVIIT